MASSIGVKVGSYPPDVLLYNLNAQHGAKTREIQENITALVDMLETDFRRMGYCANPDDMRLLNPTDCIRYADSSSIKFYTDTQNCAVWHTLLVKNALHFIGGCFRESH